MLPRELYLSINNIVNSSITDTTRREFIREVNCETKTNEKFGITTHYQGIILLKDVPREILREYLQECIDKAIKKSIESNIKPDRILCTIRSEIISSDIYLTMRKINISIADELTDLFLQLSTYTENYEDINIIGEPIQINITVVKVMS